MNSIQEIAKHLGVSTATVSRALDPRYCHLVREKTRNRILELCKIHGYRPNFSARSLRLGCQRTVGILMPFTTGHYGEMIIHIDRELVKHGYGALFSFWNTDIPSDYTAAFNRLLARGVDGIITSHYIDNPQSPGVEVVVFGNEVENFECVYPNKETFGHDAIKYLHSRGYTRIGVVGLLDDIRYRGMHNAMAELNIPYNPQWWVNSIPCSSLPKIDNAYMRQSELPQVIITHSDLIAVNVYNAARRNNVDIPDDLAVLSFDNLPESEDMFPPLTTYDQHPQLAAKLLVDAILKRIANPQLPLEKHPYHMTLIERDSVKNLI